MRQHLDVILVDLRQLVDALRIFAVMRPAMETDGGRFAFGVSAAGEVAGKQQRAHAGDVRLEGQRQQIELQFDVFVEGLRHTHRHTHIGWRDRRSLHGDLQPPLDLADVLGIVVEPRRGRRRRLRCADGRGCRSANPECCGPACAARSRCSAVLPSPNMRSNTTCGFSSIGSGWVGEDQEIVLV